MPDEQTVPPQEKKAYISFSAEINVKTTESLLATFARCVAEGYNVVHLLLSTPGGSVMNGLNIYHVLRGMPFRLITHNVGSVDSIGNVVFLAGTERFACKYATFLFHGVQFEQIAGCDEALLKEKLGSIQADQRRIATLIAERSSIPEADVERFFYDAVTKDSEYAKANGIVHEIREVSIPPGATVFQLVFQR